MSAYTLSTLPGTCRRPRWVRIRQDGSVRQLPCGRARCSAECFRKWARTLGACLILSAETYPPSLTVRITPQDPTSYDTWRRFLAKFHATLKRSEINYFNKLEFGRSGFHNHLLLRCEADFDEVRVRRTLTTLADTMEISITTYVARIRCVNAICRYVAKDTSDFRRIVPPPPSFRGRTFTYSRGYLAAPMRTLRLQVWSRWYPGQRDALTETATPQSGRLASSPAPETYLARPASATDPE